MSTSTGTVKWFNETKGFGFIVTDEGKDIFAHFTDIQTQGFKVLLEGQRVEFTVVQGKKRPSSFKYCDSSKLINKAFN